MTREEAIAEITRRLVDYYHPERICLFGSVARGDHGPDSDLDFCVAQDRLRGAGGLGQGLPARHRGARREVAV